MKLLKDKKKHPIFMACLLLSVSTLSFSHENDDTEPKKIMVKVIEAVSVTGANSFCGKSIFKFPEPFPRDLQLIFMGEHNEAPNATDVIPLNHENCHADTILASTTDQGLIDLLGGEDADTRLKNRKFHDIPTYLGPDGVRRLIPRSTNSDSMFPPVKVGAEKDINLGDWIKANGSMKISCMDNNTSTISIKFKELLPDSLYTLWGMYATFLPNQFQKQLIPVAIGGVPNAMSSDYKGRGIFERTINGCPLMQLSDGSELMMIILNYHADGSVYGGDPDTGTKKDYFVLEDGVEFLSTHPAGILNQDQLIFPVRLLEYQNLTEQQ
ncbi:MAG: hypothetical protein QM500_00905 [Methylococcales bacterium]